MPWAWQLQRRRVGLDGGGGGEGGGGRRLWSGVFLGGRGGDTQNPEIQGPGIPGFAKPSLAKGSEEFDWMDEDAD